MIKQELIRYRSSIFTFLKIAGKASQDTIPSFFEGGAGSCQMSKRPETFQNEQAPGKKDTGV